MWERPAPFDVWRAVEAYLAVAYEAAPPTAVVERLSRLRSVPEATFYECDAFECAEERYALRLGNRFFPHMKLVVEAGPGGRALFRADTHDRHFLDLVDPADAKLVELMARNAAIAKAIDDALSECGLYTPRQHLRVEAARWRAGRQRPE
jgi:hypothetical protein